MRIALDATPLAVPTGGITRYTVELHRALNAAFPCDEYLLLQAGAGALHKRWWSCGLPIALIRKDVDVFHGVDFSVPYLPVRAAVMTVHDLSPFRADRAPGTSERISRRTPWLIRLGLATMLVTPTEAIRRETISHFGIRPNRVVAVPLAASDHFRPVENGLETTPYFLFAGTLEPRKNLHLLVEAWRQVRRTHVVDLVLAGRQREDFAPLPAEPGLRLMGAVEESALPGLYSGARALVFPSLYEGFGLPVLEAMQCGAPVLVSRDPAVAEVAGNAGLSVDASDARGWVTAMTAVLENASLHSQMRAAGLARAKAFSWPQTAVQMREVYREAAARFAA